MSQQQSTAVAPMGQGFNREIAAAALAPSRGGVMAAFVPQSFEGLLEVAKLMAASGQAVPKHLRNNPGMCFSVAQVAYPNGFNPWQLATDTYVVNDILAYGAKAISAMVNNSSRMEGRLHYEWSGTWPKRIITVSGKIKGDPRPKELEVKADTITVRNSPLWKQQPDQQLAYWATRAWARVYMAEVIMGLIDADEAVEMQQAASGAYMVADDAPPRPTRATAPVHDLEPETAHEFEFTDTDGAVEDLTAEEFVARFAAAMAEASDRHILEGLWESNSMHLQALRDLGLGDAAKSLDDAFGLALDGFAVNANQQQDKPAPAAKTEPKKAAPAAQPSGDLLSGQQANQQAETIPLAVRDGIAQHATPMAWLQGYQDELKAAASARKAGAFVAANAKTWEAIYGRADDATLAAMDAVAQMAAEAMDAERG